MTSKTNISAVPETAQDRAGYKKSDVAPPKNHSLEFESHWNEGKQRRFVKIRYNMLTGAQIDILGRMTTLQRCSQLTAQWNSYWYARLLPLRDGAIEELSKYDSMRFEPWVTQTHKNALLKGVAGDGSCNIRLLLDQIDEVVMRLDNFRPRKAILYRAPDEIWEIERLPLTRPIGKK